MPSFSSLYLPDYTQVSGHFERSFPYLFVVSKTGRITRKGPLLRKALSTVVPSEGFDDMRMADRNGASVALHSLREAPEIYFARPRDSAIVLKGFFLRGGSDWVFIGFPLTPEQDERPCPPPKTEDNPNNVDKLGEGELVSIVSHEFRTPLTAIDGALYLLKRLLKTPGVVSVSQTASVNRWLDLMANSTSTLKELVDQVLTYNRMERVGDNIQFQRESPARLMTSIIDALNEAPHTPRIELINELEPTFFSYFDPLVVRAAVENLITNALKYSPDNTMVRVLLGAHAGGWKVAVEDKGRGIPQDEQKRLFSPFFRASNVGKVAGSGLGLAIVKRAARSHGAELTYSSEVGAGSRFELRFPSAPPTAPGG